MKDFDTVTAIVSSATVGAVVYPDADELMKYLIPLFAGAIAPTIKDLLGDCRDYFREKVLKLKKEEPKDDKEEQEEQEQLKKTLNDLKPINDDEKI